MVLVVEKNTVIAIIIGIVIIGVIIGYQVDQNTVKKSSTEEYYQSIGTQSIASVVYPDNPQFLYGLKINKDKYVLGESVYVTISGIPMELKDEIAFFTPEGKKYYTIDIDGRISDSGKQYFRPMLLMAKDICEKEQLIGTWKVMFMKMPNEILNFEIVNEILPNNERYYAGCTDTQQDYVVDPSRMDPLP